jgi:hypothetical protein
MLGGVELYSRNKLWEAWNGHDGGTVVNPTYGNGAAATWRMTGLISKKNEGKAPANSPGGGWNMTNVERLNESVGGNSKTGQFDVIILRVMHGWMEFDDITPDRLFEAIHLSMGLFGATTVIIQTIPFTNNVKTVHDIKRANFINGSITIRLSGRMLDTWAIPCRILVMSIFLSSSRMKAQIFCLID